MEKLGFKFSDIKILLNSHAHPDHTTGDAMIKEMTGATVMTMAEDVPALQNIRPGGKPHPIDRVLHDGDTVTLGGMTLTAHLTPGHTKGCTTWTFKTTEGGKSYDVVVVGDSVSLNATNLGDNPGYPNIRRGFRQELPRFFGRCPCDVFRGFTHRVLSDDRQIRQTRTGRTQSVYRSSRIQGSDRFFRKGVQRPSGGIEDRAAKVLQRGRQ